jgi:hypothetical protein
MTCQAFCNEESFRWVDRAMLAWHVPKPTKSFFSSPRLPKSTATGAFEAGRVVPVLEVELSASPSGNPPAFKGEQP